MKNKKTSKNKCTKCGSKNIQFSDSHRALWISKCLDCKKVT